MQIGGSGGKANELEHVDRDLQLNRGSGCVAFRRAPHSWIAGPLGAQMNGVDTTAIWALGKAETNKRVKTISSLAAPFIQSDLER